MVTPLFPSVPDINGVPIPISNRLFAIGNYTWRYVIRGRPGDAVEPPPAQQAHGQEAVFYNRAPGFPTIDYDFNGTSTLVDKWIIHSTDIQRLTRILDGGPRIREGAVEIPYAYRTAKRHPFDTRFVFKRVSFTPFDREKPMDMIGEDPRLLGTPADLKSWADTYSQLAEATLIWEIDAQDDKLKQGNGVDSDIKNFVRITSNVGGEFLNIGKQDIRLHSAGFSPGQGRDATGQTRIFAPIDDRNEVNDRDNRDFLPFDAAAQEEFPNKDYDIPLVKVVASIDHTVTFENMFEPPYDNIRNMLGKVNDAQLDWLYDAEPETVLFIGAEISQQQNKTDRNTPLWTINYKFVERSILLEDTIQENVGGENLTAVYLLTWNHVYVPRENRNNNNNRHEDLGKFMRIVVDPDTGEGLYRTGDFTNLFRRDTLKKALPPLIPIPPRADEDADGPGAPVPQADDERIA